MRPDDFPELGGSVSRAQRQRVAQQQQKLQKTLANRLAPKGSGVKIIRAADPGAGPPAGYPTGRRPAVSRSTSQTSLEVQQQQQQQLPTESGGNGSKDAMQQRDVGSGSNNGGHQAAYSWVRPETQEVRPPTSQGATGSGRISFPPLSGGQPSSGAVTQRHTGANRSLQVGTGSVFPPLGGSTRPVSAQRQPEDTGPVEPSASASQGRVSQSLKDANKVFIEKLQRQLSPQEFATFREKSAAFMHDKLTAAELHVQVAALGVASDVPTLAALCPNVTKREQLLKAHRHWAQNSSQHGSGWVPPEAAHAAADHAQLHGSWTCSMCTLTNSPGAATCEACSASPPKHHEDQQSTPSGSSAPTNDKPSVTGANAAAGKVGKQKKLPKFEKLRLTGGDAAAMHNWLETSGGTVKKNPQNAWGAASASSKARSAAAKQPQTMPAAWGDIGSSSQRDCASSTAWRKL